MAGLDQCEYLAVWESGSALDPVRRAVAVLAAIQGESPEQCAEVDVGSRDVLLGRLLATLTGPTAFAVSDCAGCGALLDVPVDVAAVCAFPVHEPGATLTTAVDDEPVSYRLPTSEDLLAVADEPPPAARRALLARCLDLDLTGMADDDVAHIGEAVERAMDEAAPAGAIDLVVRCPACAHVAGLPLDVPTLLWAEIEMQAANVLEDVHVLATAYGWTEADVLALGPLRRAAYLAMAAVS